MKQRQRIMILVILTLVIPAIILLVLRPPPRQRSGSVRFLTLTNDVGGNLSALFLATNSTDRLFVRGRAELETRRGTSNVISALQITNWAYLRPGQGMSLSIPGEGCRDPWRLRV